MEETKTLNSVPSQSPPPSPSTPSQNPSTTTPPPSSSVTRLWRPAAQRNLRNQWSKLASYRQDWANSSSSGRSHATSIVNSYLNQRSMDTMDLGVLSDMLSIRKKARDKLLKQLELHRVNLLSSYQDMVSVVKNIISASGSMRFFLKGISSSPLVQFSGSSENKNDTGDGGGIPVYTFLSISSFENLAQEIVQMFALELNLKRLLVVELLSLCSEEVPIGEFCWSDELYPGEFHDLGICSLYSEEACKPIPPNISGCKSDTPAEGSSHQLNHEVLQVDLTNWIVEVNIDAYRLDDIFAMVGEEIGVSLLKLL